MHLVLDLGLGECGAVVPAPVDGLEAFVDEAFFEEAVKGLDDAGLVGEVHRRVRIVPAAEDAEALELCALQVDVLLRVLAAGLADFDGVEFELAAAELLVDLDFDGEAVTVPARDVGRVEAGHGFRLDDEVLDALVQRVAEVDGAVGVGRAVVQDVFGRSGAGTANLLVEAGRLPDGEALGLASGQVRLHGEVGLRQIQGVLEPRLLVFLVGLLLLWGLGPSLGHVGHELSVAGMPQGVSAGHLGQTSIVRGVRRLPPRTPVGRV